MPNDPPARWPAIRRWLLSLTDDERAYVVRWVTRWVAPSGRLLAVRGAFDEDEPAEVPTAQRGPSVSRDRRP
jgi:hypothetical protein